jgi:hypothetical protein
MQWHGLYNEILLQAGELCSDVITWVCNVKINLSLSICERSVTVNI